MEKKEVVKTTVLPESVDTKNNKPMQEYFVPPDIMSQTLQWYYTSFFMAAASYAAISNPYSF
jgi:hypothetical protein